MASQSERKVPCIVCDNIVKDAVILSCSHSFCKSCLSRPHQRPVCKRTFLGTEAVCSLHQKKLFCLDHQQPVCVVCRDSENLTDRRLKPVDELQGSLKPLQEKLEVFKKAQVEFHQTAEHIKTQSRHAEIQIKEQFEKLPGFLEEEEEARMAALREEEEQKSRMMKEKIAALSREMKTLSDMIRASEKELTAEEVQQHLLLEEPELSPGALIDVAKHLGNLSFHIWVRMKDVVSYSPVILDPNTADRELVLSADLTGVRWEKSDRCLPENPERFGLYASVLGSEGLDSGTHSWVVEVGDNTEWVLGVLAESEQRKGIIQSGLWTVWFCEDEFRIFSPPESLSVLPVRTAFRRIRLDVDREAGQLSFSDPDTDTHIHTFTHTFTEKLFPYINTWKGPPMRILPTEISVTTR